MPQALSRLQRSWWLSLVIACTVYTTGCRETGQGDSGAKLRRQCVHTMRETLREEQRWAKVHAAEFLTALDYRDGVRQTFQAERELYQDQPEYRIGILRVFANLDRHDRPAYQTHSKKIWSVFADHTAPDRIHAIETLAKLNYQLPRSPAETGSEASAEERLVRAFAAEGPAGGRAYAWWVLLNNSGSDAEENLCGLLAASDANLRRTAAYVLRHQAAVSPETAKALAAAATIEPEGAARVYLSTAALRHWPGAGREEVETELLELLKSGTSGERYEVSRLAADVGDDWSDTLATALEQVDVSRDVKSSIAHALCRIDRRRMKRMSLVDWTVVAAYATVLLCVGVYFARRTKTAGDFLLGGRAMRPWAVGLSLFATLLSTLSYLAVPGEMIKNGPIILLGITAHPLVFWVVGWFLIPRLMQLEVTSAYEILEKRLGVSVRLLGSTLFLSLRFLWMASIIYWTTSIVLLPAAGLDDRYSGVFIVVLGLITVAYTSLGGLRAVIVTDVIQTLILFAAAITTLVLITRHLGGISAWFPDQWAAHWAVPRYWFDFDPNARATLANAMLGVFTWHVCTAGSDQMAIQRYLSTRDVQAARRSLAVSLLTDMSVMILLGLTGLALLSFFSAHPDRLADGHSIYSEADKLFPRFVVVGLPIGMSGLVIAGLLAAAMSSLSSGVNSSAAVICEDFVRRLTRKASSETAQVQLARWVSVAVGVGIVALSTFVEGVQGNMFEVIYKVVNLFVAPLFFLFFMAIFVKRANTVGTWLGAIAGIATAFFDRILAGPFPGAGN